MDIGELNRRLSIQTSADTVDEGGGISAEVVSSYSVWAKVEDRSGSLYTGQQQEQWAYDYKITMRYEKSRIKNEKQTILYQGKTLRINSISLTSEGNKRFEVARCSVII